MTPAIRTISAVSIALLAFVPSGSLDAQSQGRARRLYIVQMADLPAGSYAGGVAGLARTKPQRGRRLDSSDPTVAAYAAYLDARHNEALARAGGGRKVYDYRYVFNGFAAELSDAQAAALRASPGVLNVTRDELQNADTSSTPDFLGLTEGGGLWDQVGGVANAGEDVIVAIVDSGIWPENPSFSDRTGPQGKKSYQHIPHWRGKCVPGQQFPASKCNQKVIGARHYNAAWGGDAGLKALRPWEFASPRDYNGHGSHTASTAAGNHDVALTGLASVFGTGSGIAPRARIAVYKALWSLEDGSQASGFTSDLVAAIDQAVADGVDVINYSVAGTTTNFLEPVQVAFLFAADAGVFVSASAGNSGPNTGTVAHPSPWITTVAAGTHNRTGNGSVTLGNGATFTGGSLAAAVGPAPLIASTAAGLPGADPEAVRLCYSAGDTEDDKPVLDPAKIAGRIVVCERGITARVAKSLAVRDGGGIGMILLNVTSATESVNADFHFVPTVHLAFAHAPTVLAYAATPAATAAISNATIAYDVAAPFTAAFSSRGPSAAARGDLLKPDVIAPGQDIVAAVAPPGNGGESFNVYSGTSMSAPHVAGLAALLRDLHPDWSPMMIKSALMTTASDVLDGPNTNPLVIFRQGAGHVRPNRAVDPGLVFDADINDWLAFLCGATTGVNPAVCSSLSSLGYSFDSSDVNLASIAIGDLLHSQTVARTVTNVGGTPETYTASVAGVSGVAVQVDPSSFTIAPGASRTFTVTFTRTSAAFNTFTGGQLTLAGSSHTARLPIAIRPAILSAPAEVSGTGGPIDYSVRFGYTGPFAATPRGLIPAATSDHVVEDDPDDTFDLANPEGTKFDIVVPPGTSVIRFATFDADVSPASDIDLWVYRGTTPVALSGGPTSQEQVTLPGPTGPDPVTYTIYLHGFAVPGTANVKFYSWLLGTTSAGNMMVSAPGAATAGTSGSIGLTFNGLDPATKYLGSVVYTSGAATLGTTLVSVNTP